MQVLLLFRALANNLSLHVSSSVGCVLLVSPAVQAIVLFLTLAVRDTVGLNGRRQSAPCTAPSPAPVCGALPPPAINSERRGTWSPPNCGVIVWVGNYKILILQKSCIYIAISVLPCSSEVALLGQYLCFGAVNNVPLIAVFAWPHSSCAGCHYKSYRAYSLAHWRIQYYCVL